MGLRTGRRLKLIWVALAVLGAGLALGGLVGAQAAPAGTTPTAGGLPTTTVVVVHKHRKHGHHHHHTHTTTTPTVGTPPPTATVAPPTPAPPPPVAAPVTPVAVATHAALPPKRAVHDRAHHRVHHRPHRRVHKHHKNQGVPPPPAPRPKPAPKAPSLPNQVKVVHYVATPSALHFKLGSLALAAVAGGFLILLLAFPAELFNKTYEENQHEIHGVFTRFGLQRYHLPPLIGLIAFVLIGTALTAWLALGEGSDGNPVAVAVGLLVAVPLVNFAWELPVELYSRHRSRIPGELHVLPTALIVGLSCALLSRALKLHPAYLYGVFAAFTAARTGSLSREHAGKAVLISVAILAVLGIGSWFAWGALAGHAEGDHRTWATIILATAFFWVFVLSAEALVFGLVPLDYLHGKALRRWRSRLWVVAQVLAAAFFVYVQVLHGESEKVSDWHELIRPAIFFLVFGALSFAFWGYFHWARRPTARFAAHEGPAGAEMGEVAPAEGEPGIAT
jgi:hypothetical protein